MRIRVCTAVMLTLTAVWQLANGFEAGTTQPAPVVRDAATQAREVAEIVQGMRAEVFAQRELAYQRLVGMGPEIVPAIREARGREKDPEVAARLGEAMFVIEERAALTPPMVTLHLKRATPKQFFEAMEQQYVANYEMDTAGVQTGEITVDCDKKPVVEVLAAVNRQWPVWMRAASPPTLTGGGKKGLYLAADSGLAAITDAAITRSITVDAADPRAKPANGYTMMLTARFFTGAPHIHSEIEVLRAVEESGRLCGLTPKNTNDWPDSCTNEVVLGIKEGAKALKRVDVALRFTLELHREELVIRRKDRAWKEVDGVRVKLASAVVHDSMLTYKLEVMSQRMNAEELDALYRSETGEWHTTGEEKWLTSNESSEPKGEHGITIEGTIGLSDKDVAQAEALEMKLSFATRMRKFESLDVLRDVPLPTGG
jgi:hypothetical protein